MKTPREILLSRHQSAEPKLDAMRAKALKGLNHKETKDRGCDLVSWFLRCPETVWRELIFPARRIWTGFAVAWVTIVMVNIAASDHSSPAVQAKGKAASENAFAAWREQQKILAELNGVSEPMDADRPKPFAPKPHSEREKLQGFA